MLSAALITCLPTNTATTDTLFSHLLYAVRTCQKSNLYTDSGRFRMRC